jgi:hypothetical protein
VFNVHGQLESLGFKQVKKKTTALHGKQIRWQKAFTIPHQWLTPKTQGNFRLEAHRSQAPDGQAAATMGDEWLLRNAIMLVCLHGDGGVPD